MIVAETPGRGAPPVEGPSSASLSRGYTVALLGLGVFNLAGAAVLWSQSTSMPEAGPGLAAMGPLALLKAVACLVIAASRFGRFGWARDATAALNVLLLLNFPLGTALSLYWLLILRKREGRTEGDSSVRVLVVAIGLAVVASLVFVIPMMASTLDQPLVYLVSLSMMLGVGVITVIVVNVIRHSRYVGGDVEAEPPAWGLRAAWVLSLVSLLIFYLLPVTAGVMIYTKLAARDRQPWSPASSELWRLAWLNSLCSLFFAVAMLIFLFGYFLRP